MPKVYSEAETVEQIAGNLIPMFHPHLATARISYTFVDKASNKGGRPVPGSVKKITGLMEYHLERDFIIEVAADQWGTFSETQRRALVDHLLERCYGEEDEDGGGDMKWSLREPDVSEFSTILRRHGAWTAELAGFVSVAKQIDIDEVVAEAAAEEVVTTENVLRCGTSSIARSGSLMCWGKKAQFCF